jgi:osmotically-inducible protein OsmY
MVESLNWLDSGTATARPTNALGTEEAAVRRLRDSAYLELRRVNCTVENKILRLHGCVSSYYIRQLAQTMLKGLEGVEGIDNQLEVIQRRVPR